MNRLLLFTLVVTFVGIVVPDTAIAQEPYSPPTNVTAQAIDPWTVKLTWSHAAFLYDIYDQDGYKWADKIGFLTAPYGSTVWNIVNRLQSGTAYTFYVVGVVYDQSGTDLHLSSGPVAVTTPEGPSAINFQGVQTGPGTILWSWDVANPWKGAIPPMALHGGDLTDPGSPYTISSAAFTRTGTHVEVVEKGVPEGNWTRHVAVFDPYNRETPSAPFTVTVTLRVTGDLLVDADRNGAVELADNPPEDDLVDYQKPSGALILVNCDDDEGKTIGGTFGRDCDDRVVNGAADAADLSDLQVRLERPGSGDSGALYSEVPPPSGEQRDVGRRSPEPEAPYLLGRKRDLRARGRHATDRHHAPAEREPEIASDGGPQLQREPEDLIYSSERGRRGRLGLD